MVTTETKKKILFNEAPKLYSARECIEALNLKGKFTRENLIRLAQRGALKYYKCPEGLQTRYRFDLADVKETLSYEIVEAS